MECFLFLKFKFPFSKKLICYKFSLFLKMVKCDICAISRLKTATISTVCHYSMLVTLHKICRVYLDLLERNGFLFLKAKNETFSPAGWSCRRNHKYEN